jgi:hypothetical protein
MTRRSVCERKEAFLYFKWIGTAFGDWGLSGWTRNIQEGYQACEKQLEVLGFARVKLLFD